MYKSKREWLDESQHDEQQEGRDAMEELFLAIEHETNQEEDKS